MTIMNHIEGVLTLTSPLHCSAGAEGNLTRTMKQPLVGPNGTNLIPYFPANDLRGRLRRKAATIVLNHLTQAEGRVSVELMSGLTCGAISASSQNDVSVEEILRARGNVYMGVFGGGTRIMRSGIQVHDLLPFVGETLDAGMVPSNLGVEVPKDVRNGATAVAAPIPAWQLVHRFRTIRVDDVYRVTNLSLLDRSLEDATGEVSEYQEAVLAGRNERKADKATVKKTDLGNMMEAEAIAAGTPLHLRIDLHDHLTDAQRGLVLLALRDLVNEQALGGMVRHGWGKFKADVRGKFDGNNVDDMGNALPAFQQDSDTGIYELAGLAKQYGESAMAEIQALTIDDMWNFFKPTKIDA